VHGVRYPAARLARTPAPAGGDRLLTDDGITADGLLLSMPALWEAVVRRLAAEAAAVHGGDVVPSHGEAAITVRGDLGKTSAFRPDVLLSLPGREIGHRVLLPVDAKYKRYDRHGVGADDIHQLLTYGVGHASDAVIIHPRPGGHATRTLQVEGPRGRLGTIRVLGVGTCAPPEQAATWMGSVLL
jgi:5-methylcytosine-specific restriction enzyme subunit McrC